jgi:hypothetical protein
MCPSLNSRKRRARSSSPEHEPDNGPISSEEEYERFRLTPVDPGSISAASGLDRSRAEAFSRRLFRRRNRLMALVACVDIRASTTYMLHLEEFTGYSKHLADFLGELKSIVIAHRGFFDKFTGDGALVFWPTFKPSMNTEGFCRALHALLQVQVQFLDEILPMFRARGGLLPKNFGLAIGLDYGEVMVSDLRPSIEKITVSVYQGGERTFDIGKDPLTKSVTVLGRAVVGAVRMASEAKANRFLCNNFPGQRFARSLSDINDKFEKPWSITRGLVQTKEVPGGQFAYELSYPAVEHLADEHLGANEWLGRTPGPS